MKFLSRLVSNVHNTFITLKYEIRIEDTYCFDILNESAEAARTTMSAVIEKSTSSCVKTLPENLIHLLLRCGISMTMGSEDLFSRLHIHIGAWDEENHDDDVAISRCKT